VFNIFIDIRLFDFMSCEVVSGSWQLFWFYHDVFYCLVQLQVSKNWLIVICR